MATIVETISGDKRLKLGNEQFVRKLAVGSNWNVIQVYLRLAFDCSAASVSNPLFVVGLCSGTTNCFGDASTTNFYGLITKQATAATMNYASSPQANSHNFTLQTVKKVGTTITQFGSDFAGIITSVPATHHSCIGIQFQKTNVYGNICIAACRLTNSTSGTVDIPLNSYLLWLAGGSLSSYSWQQNNISSYDLAPGALDTVNIAWNNDVYKMEISDIGVYRYC